MPLIQQLQPRFVELAQLYTAREKPSKMYHWTTFVLSVLLVEIPYNLITGTIFFLPWYFAVGFYHDWPPGSSQRGGYMWLLFMTFQMWFSTFGHAMAALAPNAETASVFTTLFASFVIAFSGVLQPLSRLIGFYHWVYWLSPYHYIVEGMMATAVHDVPIVCAPKEINHFSPPPGQTCGEYAGKFVQVIGNLLNPSATADCAYCRYKDSDQYLGTVNMSYGNRWRNLGFILAYVLFNMGMTFAFFYLTKVKVWNLTGLAKMKARIGRS
jgi:ABC-type multidrug transport system permease subunit